MPEVALDQDLAAAGTAAHAQLAFELRSHLLDRLVIGDKAGDNRRLLAAAALAFQHDAQAAGPLLLQGVTLVVGSLFALVGSVVPSLGDGHVKRFAQRVFPVGCVHC